MAINDKMAQSNFKCTTPSCRGETKLFPNSVVRYCHLCGTFSLDVGAESQKMPLAYAARLIYSLGRLDALLSSRGVVLLAGLCDDSEERKLIVLLRLLCETPLSQQLREDLSDAKVQWDDATLNQWADRLCNEFVVDAISAVYLIKSLAYGVGRIRYIERYGFGKNDADNQDTSSQTSKSTHTTTSTNNRLSVSIQPKKVHPGESATVQWMVTLPGSSNTRKGKNPIPKVTLILTNLKTQQCEEYMVGISGTRKITPSASMRATLKYTTRSGETGTANADVRIIQPLTLTNFIAEPPIINQGDVVCLRWTARYCRKVTLNFQDSSGMFHYNDVTHQTEFKFMPDRTLNATLIGEGFDGERKHIKIEVGVKPRPTSPRMPSVNLRPTVSPERGRSKTPQKQNMVYRVLNWFMLTDSVTFTIAANKQIDRLIDFFKRLIDKVLG